MKNLSQPGKNRLYVVIAIFPENDATTVSVASTAEQAANDWKQYMLNGETFDSKSEREKTWLVEQAYNLATYGKTDRQDSGVFYRLNPMIQK